MTRRSVSLLLMLASLCAGAHPAAAQEADEDFDMFEEEFVDESVTISDPFRGLNRVMFDLNDKVYFSVIKPIARGYRKVTPRVARISLRNFFHNLAAPGRFANCVLQGKGKGANTELKRFLVNSTVGILGLADPATEKMGLEATREDLGQTLATYGFGNGFYIVWPFFGPSTLRDSLGRAGDIWVNPLVYVNRTDAYLVLALAKSANE
ncbi:MAG: VacJ family lipoprotein, partial [Planctomycetes bacterium]|nr:VacJ family lipoprotein [Planctomycetota bacterium]